MKSRYPLIFVAMLACSCCSTFSQVDPQCQADLQNLKLPSRAFIDSPLGGDTVLDELGSEPPVLLLFSQNGVDIYSATDFKAIGEWQRFGVSDVGPLTIIAVYQSEKAREPVVEMLEKDDSSTPDWRKTRPPRNVKFAVFRFEFKSIWVDNVLHREWLISRIAFFEPYSCLPPDEDEPAISAFYEGPSGHARYDKNQLCAAGGNCLNLIDGINVPRGEQTPPPSNSILSKALDMMRAKLAAYGLPN